MTGRKTLLAGSLFLAVLALSPRVFAASSFSDIHIFGDSLSDTGNLAVLISGLDEQPEIPDGLVPNVYPILGVPVFRFSNDKLYSEYLAEALGQSCDPVSSAPTSCDAWPIEAGLGLNRAISGSGTGILPDAHPYLSEPTDLPAQVDRYLAAVGKADKNALYILFSGSNDVLNLLAAIADPESGVTAAQLPGLLSNGAKAEIRELQRLSQAGARYFLLIGLPNIGLAPSLSLSGNGAAGTSASLLFNGILLKELFRSGVKGRVWYFDSFTVTQYIATDAKFLRGRLTGVKNLETPCAPELGFGVDCNDAFFWDMIHPTTRVHKILADAAAKVLNWPPLISKN